MQMKIHGNSIPALAYFGIKKAYVEEWAFIVIALPGTGIVI